jgi:UDP-N-acetylglucosamine 2-epimerase
MPEEINRILTDHVSEWLFCPTQLAIENLNKEGIVKNVVWSGDVMYDAALTFSTHAKNSDVLSKYNLTSKQFKLATVHRAENTDSPEALRAIFEALIAVSSDTPVVLPLHPRTQNKLEQYELMPLVLESALVITEPVNFLDMICLEKNAQLILTDSGGIQKEAFFHHVPCVTLREETEWVELVNSGWNSLVGSDKQLIIENTNETISRFVADSPDRSKVDYGNGQASQMIIDCLVGKL